MTRRVACELLPALLCVACVAGAQPQAAQAPARPQLALALSGGGARGIAHIGALRALEEAGLVVDAIAANSMGAVVGGIYASGRTSGELEAIVRSLDWALLFSGRPDRRALPVVRREDRLPDLFGFSFDGTRPRLPAGLLAEQRVNRFLIEYLSPASYAAGSDFDRLPIRFRAVASDLGSGERVVLARGDLARAVRASMSIPVFFPPVEWEGRRLVDGLLVDNLPTDVARAFGAAVTVAVDISSPELEPADYESALGVAEQVSNLLSARRNQDFAVEPDVLVRPDLGRHLATDYSGFDELIRAGHEATRQALPRIRALLAAAKVADEPRHGPPAGRGLEGSRIAAVVARGNQRVSERLLRRIFNIPLGRGYEMKRGLRALDKVTATGLLEHAWMEFEPAEGGVTVVLRGKDAAPNRVGVGIAYNEWEKARGSLRLRNQNALGFGERVELLLAASDAFTLAQAWLRGDRLLVAGLGYSVAGYSFTDKPRYFDEEGDETNRGKFERQGASFSLSGSLERWGLVEAGARFGRVKTVEQPGIPLPDANDRVALVFARLALDTADDPRWPESGARLAATGEWSVAGMGADRPYWLLQLDGRGALGLSRRATLELDGFVALSGDELPAYEQPRLGGPTLVPGYRFEELKGAQALAGALSVRYRVAGALRLVARGGAGNVFAETQDIGLADLRWGVGIGAYYPTRLGPLAVELAVRDDGRSLVSLSFGGY